jgi:hypothetical protein
MNASIRTTRREAEERLRVEHVSAEAALALMVGGPLAVMHPFPGKSVLRGARDGRLNMSDAVAVWQRDRPAALCWTAKTGAEGTERLSLLELLPSPGDAMRVAVEALLPSARDRGVTRFEATISCDEPVIDNALRSAGLIVTSRLNVGGVADVCFALPAQP